MIDLNTEINSFIDEEDIQLLIKQSVFFQGKTVLVTGGAGSLGSAIVKKLIQITDVNVIVADQSELFVFNLKNEIGLRVNVKYYLVDVSQVEELKRVFNENVINVVIHTAAYKHVALMEDNPHTSFKQNVLATKIVYELSVKFKVTTFLYVSSDKAVYSKGVMGGTKRIAELFLLSQKRKEGCRVIISRFGNLWGSSGSVIPLFIESAKEGKSLKVTSPDANRYFIKVSNAATLLLGIISSVSDDGIFISKTGDPKNILEIAKKIKELFNAKNEIEITGISEYEKLNEDLNFSYEKLTPSFHPNVFSVDSTKLIDEELVIQINSLLKEYRSVSKSELSLLIKSLSLR